MTNLKWIRMLFYAIAVYDGVLGVIFFFFPVFFFNTFQVTLPNHFGYVQFPACLLVIFALMFYAVAQNPVMNRNLIPYGVLLKVAYSGIVFGYWFTSGIPNMWKPFALIDTVTAVLFIWAYINLIPAGDDTKQS